MAQNNLIAVDLQRSGGQVPTYRPSVRVDAKELSAEERADLERLLRKADFFQQPAQFPATAAEVFEYRLTVQSTEQSHTVVFHDRDGHPEALDQIRDWLNARQPK